ncbi:MAG: hypothetical protein ACOCQR_00850 [bacterium]
MVLYHITYNLKHDGIFIPKIPSKRLNVYNYNENTDMIIVKNNILEEDQIKRVCVSKTVEGCLSSMPRANFFLKESFKKKGNKFKVFKIDTKKLNIDNVLDEKFLYQKDLVRDAEVTKECWITESFIVSEVDSFIIEVESFEETILSVIPFRLKEKLLTGDIVEELKRESLHVLKISNLKYKRIVNSSL